MRTRGVPKRKQACKGRGHKHKFSLHFSGDANTNFPIWKYPKRISCPNVTAKRRTIVCSFVVGCSPSSDSAYDPQFNKLTSNCAACWTPEHHRTVSTCRGRWARLASNPTTACSGQESHTSPRRGNEHPGLTHQGSQSGESFPFASRVQRGVLEHALFKGESRAYSRLCYCQAVFRSSGFLATPSVSSSRMASSRDDMVSCFFRRGTSA